MTRTAFLGFFGLAPQTRVGPEGHKLSDGVLASINGVTGAATVEAPLVLVLEAGKLILRSTATGITAKPRVRNELLVQSLSNPLQYALKVAANSATLEVWRDGLHLYTTATPLPDYRIIGPNLIELSAHYAGVRGAQVYANYDPT